MDHELKRKAHTFDLPLWGMATASGCLLFLVSLRSYLLFHTLVELITVAVAWALFLVSWNTREHSTDTGFLALGMGYLFVGLLDLLHTLSYEGMAVLPNGGAGLATQYWIAARWVEVAAILSCLILARSRIRPGLFLFAFLVIFLLLFSSIQIFSIFPDCFVPGKGLTPFKILSEYLFILILIICMILVFRQRVGEGIPTNIRWIFVAALLVTVFSEMAFTLYSHPFGTANMIGHLLKYLSFLLIYKAVLVDGLSKPFEILFQGIGMRDRILGAVARISRELIEQPGNPNAVDKALAVLGEASGVHRVYIFENHRDDAGKLLASQRNEWCISGVASFADDPLLWNVSYADSGFGRWELFLSAGDRIVGDIHTFPDAEQLLLKQQGIVSLAVIPLFVHTRWWGFIGFDDCTSCHAWNSTELDALQMAGSIIASWLERKRMEEDLVQSIEAEQARFGKEIHDSICQELKGLEIEAAIGKKYGVLPSSLEKRLNNLLQDASRIARGLFPKELRRDEFLSALEDLEKSSIAGECISLQIDEEAIPGAPGLCYQLEAVCREAVCNARYHSGSGRIEITLERPDGYPVLVVQDKGCGFHPDSRGMGIRIMEARAAAMGAVLDIRSEPDKGTRVSCRSLSRRWGNSQ